MVHHLRKYSKTLRVEGQFVPFNEDSLQTLICYSNPGSHPFIKDEEKEFLERELGVLKRDRNLPPVPWKAIITSAPMLALICAQIGHDWGFFIMVTDLPKYMSDVLNFPIKENGLFSALPYAVMWIVSITTGFLGDWMITKNIMGITMSRKVFTTIGKYILITHKFGNNSFLFSFLLDEFHKQSLSLIIQIHLFVITLHSNSHFLLISIAAIGPAVFTVLASYAGCSKTNSVVLFTIAMGLMGTFYPGMKVNPLDLSPNYAGTLMAIVNGIGAITGILAPYIVGVLTPNVSIEVPNFFKVAYFVFTGFFVSSFH